MSKRLYRKLNLTDNEIVIDVIRKSLWYWLWPLFLAITLLLLPFFLIYPLLLQGTWGLIVFGIVCFLALILIYRIYRSYHYTVLVITNKKLIDMEQNGIFHNNSSVILYGKIKDVNYKSSGIWQTIFKIGRIHISFINDNDNYIELIAIKYPSLVVGKIIRERENYFETKRQTAGREAIRLLLKIKNKLGEDKYNRLISN